MGKLVLNVETLQVESFETVPQVSSRGTVAGQEALVPARALVPTDQCTSEWEATCDTDCDTGYTCGTLCWGTSACQRTQFPLCTQ